MKKVKKGPKIVRRPDKSKSDQPATQNKLATDFRALIGIAAKGPMNPNPKFANEDQIWERDAD